MKAIPGDPGKVAAAGNKMLHDAQVMASAAAQLTKFVNPADYTSKAISALSHNAEQLAVVMQHSSVRYHGTGEALTEYAPVLAHSQSEVNAAMAAMSSTDVHSAELADAKAHAINTATQHNPLASDADKHTAAQKAQAASNHLHDQKTSAAAAQTRYDNAVHALDVAASSAINKITQAEIASKLNDGLGDHLKNFVETVVSPLLDALHEILSEFSDIMGALALICAGFPPAAELFTLFGAAADVLDFGVQNARYSIGDISLAELMVAAAIAVISVLGILDEGLTTPAAKKTVKEVVKGQVKDGGISVVEGVADGTTEGASDVSNPDDFWFGRQDNPFDSFAHHDVSPGGSTPSIDVQSIINADFGNGPVSCSVASSSYPSTMAA